MKKYLYFFLFGAMVFAPLVRVHAQELLLEQKPDEYGKGNFGANRKFFIQTSFGVGTLVGNGGGANLSINNWRSNAFTFGVRFKVKVTNFFSIWLEPAYHYASYNINQTGSKITDSLFWGKPVTHQLERFTTDGFMLNGFLRFNFDTHRGDFLGYYLDIGIGTDFFLNKEYDAVDKESNGSVVHSNITNIPYMNNNVGHAFVKLGINWLAFVLDYRYTDLFEAKYNIPEPARLTLGIEANPYSH